MSYKPKKRNQIVWERMFKKFFFKFFVPAVIFCIGIILLFNADFLKVKNITFENTKNTNPNQLEQIAQTQLQGRYWSMFDKNNILFYPETAIEKEILEKDKRVQSVNISYKGWKGDIEIDIEERQAAFLYCPEAGVLENCYFMEQDGKIFTAFNQEEVGILKKDFLVFSDTVEEKTIPDVFWEAETFGSVLSLINELQSIDIEIRAVEKREFGEVVLSTNNGSKIVLLLQQDFGKVSETLNKVSIRKDLKIDTVAKDFAEKIEYINLSHGENVFYCLAGEECVGNY